MPTYVYACTECDHRFEAQQVFSDDALTQCPNCGGKLRKVFNSVGIVFKGSGFYRTDSRGKNADASSDSSSSAAKETSSAPAKESSTASSANGSSTTSSSSSSGSSSRSSTSTPSSGSAA